MGALASLRLPVAFGFALLITAATFWFLARMIWTPTDINQMAKAARIEFTRMRKDTEVESKREEVRKAERERAAQVPVAPRLSVSTNTSITAAPVQMVQPKIDASGVKMNLTAGGSDHGALPLVDVKPIYPNRASERGISGYVILRFTVTLGGTVKDIEVIESEPKGVFEESSVKAAQNWRFTPYVQNGVPMQRVGIRRRLTFQMED